MQGQVLRGGCELGELAVEAVKLGFRAVECGTGIGLSGEEFGG